MPNGEIDITRNIKIIEGFQCELLNSLAQLFTSMQDAKATTKERAEILSNIVIVVYLLSEKLGISPTALDTKVLSRLKIGLLEEGATDEWKAVLLSLSRYIDKTRDFVK